MNPGETLLNFDFGNHLWIVISPEDADGNCVVVSLTTHRPGCIDPSCHLVPGDHPFVTRESCVCYRKAILTPVAPLVRAREQGYLRQAEPLGPALLRRVQAGALASRFASRAVKAAVRASL